MRTSIKVGELGGLRNQTQPPMQVVLAEWLVKNGRTVFKDDVVAVIETDKVAKDILAPCDGVLHYVRIEDDVLRDDEVIGYIEVIGYGVPEKPGKLIKGAIVAAGLLALYVAGVATAWGKRK
jgi:pyruvate/2-oxoglutarate dehydrogenase complex dihydrolipoamide acyltransferase (E2) component